MSRDITIARDASEARNFSRREVLGFIAATAAASLVGRLHHEKRDFEPVKPP
jgi:hypothetical protein